MLYVHSTDMFRKYSVLRSYPSEPVDKKYIVGLISNATTASFAAHVLTETAVCEAFCQMCADENLPMIRDILFYVMYVRKQINLSRMVCAHNAFETACAMGHLSVAQELHRVCPAVLQVCGTRAHTMANLYEQHHVVAWLTHTN